MSPYPGLLLFCPFFARLFVRPSNHSSIHQSIIYPSILPSSVDLFCSFITQPSKCQALSYDDVKLKIIIPAPLKFLV